jgi:ligand-binding sensor domain-containing protein
MANRQILYPIQYRLIWIGILMSLSFLANHVTAAPFDPFFRNIGVSSGLSNRKVNTILKDRRGFMWFGTEDGLNRYDGRYFTVFRNEPRIKGSLSGNIITDLYEDKNGILWIATADGGLTRYNYKLEPSHQFKQYKHNPHDAKSIPENSITKIVGDNQGNLWLASSNNYVIRFDKSKERFTVPRAYGARAVHSLAIIADTLFSGGAGGGLVKINTKTLQVTEDPRYDDFYKSLPHVSITAIFLDKKDNIWLGSWDKIVYRYSRKEGRDVAFRPGISAGKIPNDEVLSFTEDNRNWIWMAGKNSGLFIYKPKDNIFENLRNNPFKEGTLASDHVNDVYVDHDGIVWIGTNEGISMYDPLFAPFELQVLSKRDDLVVYDFYTDKTGKLWVGTNEGIYFRPPGQTKFVLSPLTYKGVKLAVTKFFRDQDGQMYLGTDYTLFRYNESLNIVSELPNTGLDPVMKRLVSSRIVSIIRDTLSGHPVLLTSPYGHLMSYYDLKLNKWFSRDSLKGFGLKDNLIRKFFKDSGGKLWLANYKFGLGTLKNESNRHYISYFINDPDNNYSLSSNHVFDIVEASKGNFWISTYGGGVDYLNTVTQKFTHMAESSNLTEGMHLDINQNLWMACNGHIHKYTSSSKIYTCYELPSTKSSGGARGYFFNDENRKLYIAVKNGFISFHPTEVEEIPLDLNVYLTDFKIFNVSHSELLSKKEIKLDYDKNFFSIEFSAPSYTGDNVNYHYLLEGVDKDWIDAGKRNTAYYANLKGGRYIFKVRASNWKNGGMTKIRSISVEIIPPFWVRWYFYTAILILCLLLGYLLYRMRVNVLLKQQGIRNGIAKDLHDQVGSTLSSISIYSEVAQIYQANGEWVELKSILGTISQTSVEMISEMGDIVWAINPINDDVDSIFKRINSYAEPLCRAKCILFEFDYDNRLLKSDLGMRIRKNLYLIIKEAINNAIKHSGCKHITVRLSLEGDIASLSIKDDGAGFELGGKENSKAQFSGNGLKNIKHRARELDATYHITSEPGMGCRIELKFELKKL